MKMACVEPLALDRGPAACYLAYGRQRGRYVISAPSLQPSLTRASGSTLPCRLRSRRARIPDFEHTDALPVPTPIRKEGAMEVLYPRCAGLDIHKKSVVASRWITDRNGPLVKETLTFG